MSQTITLQVTPADQAKSPYFYVPVEVPAGTTRIDVVLAYPKAADCIIDLGMFDPGMGDFPSQAGFRGWSGGFRDRFFVATDDATPGYIHGPLPAGAWNIILGLYKLPPGGAEVTLSIDLDDAERATTSQPVRTEPVRVGAGWYKGDLHCHTYHSDAAGSPETLHAAARQAGLDFLAITDHNTISQRRYFHPQSTPDLVFMRGMEMTTATGHANIYGVDDWIDFRMTRSSDAHILADEVHRRGGLLSINHDKPPIPWEHEWPDADCMEVFHEPWLHWNWVTLERWQARLASGMRLPAIGGSDYHQPAQLQPEGPLVLGRPTTVFWLEELSERAVLAAMKVGRGYMTESPTGPHIAIKVNNVPMGGTVTHPETCLAEVRGAKGDTLVWIDARGTLTEQPIHSDDCLLELAMLDGAETFVRAEIVARASRERLIDEMLAAHDPRRIDAYLQDTRIADQPIRRALSNPVYIQG